MVDGMGEHKEGTILDQIHEAGFEVRVFFYSPISVVLKR